MENIQERISTVMAIKNLSNAEFANTIGVQPSNISHLLSGRNKPSLDLIMKIVKRFPEIRLEWLLQGDGSMNKEYGFDLFGSKQEEQVKRNAPTTPNESKIPEHGQAQSQIPLAFEVKKTEIVAKSPQIEIDNITSDLTDSSTNKNKSTTRSEDLALGIEKIVIFYKDKTFTTYSQK